RIARASRRAWRRLMKHSSLVVAVGLELFLHGTSIAADPRFPDWPCNQAKVPELSIAAVWTGPSIDDVGNAWQDDPAIRDLVARSAARRTPLADAQKAIADFLAGPQAERQRKAKLVFTGLFATLGDERSAVVRGIERYAHRQTTFADQLRSTISRLHELQDAPDHDHHQIDDMTARVEWETRIFEERRRTIGFVCEVPVI